MPWAKSFSCISLFNIPSYPWVGNNYFPHFTGKTEAYRTWRNFQDYSALVLLGFKLRLSGSRNKFKIWRWAAVFYGWFSCPSPQTPWSVLGTFQGAMCNYQCMVSPALQGPFKCSPLSFWGSRGDDGTQLFPAHVTQMLSFSKGYLSLLFTLLSAKGVVEVVMDEVFLLSFHCC